MGNDKEKNTPAFTIHLNNSKLSTEKESQIADITVIGKLNNPSKFLISIFDPKGDWIDGDDINIGTKVKISMGYKDDVEEMIRGQITGLNVHFNKNFGRTVIVEGYNSLHKLNRSKKNTAFTDKSYSDAIKDIIQKASLQCDVCDIGSSIKFMFQKEMTDLEYIRQITDQYNCTIDVEEEKIVIKEFKATKNEDVTLEWNKTLINFQPSANSENVFTEVDLYSWNKIKMESVLSSKTNNNSDSDDLKNVAKKICKKKEYIIKYETYDEDKAGKLALSALKSNARRYITASGTARGNTKIKPGAVIKIKGVPDLWKRVYHVIYAKHHYVKDYGYLTEFEVELYKTST